jgi:hypothetical protein
MSDSQAQPWTDENLEAHVRDTLAFQREIGWPWMTETLERNANGSYWCSACRRIVILFDDDTHDDCIGHDWKDDAR